MLWKNILIINNKSNFLAKKIITSKDNHNIGLDIYFSYKKFCSLRFLSYITIEVKFEFNNVKSVQIFPLIFDGIIANNHKLIFGNAFLNSMNIILA